MRCILKLVSVPFDENGLSNGYFYIIIKVNNKHSSSMNVKAFGGSVSNQSLWSRESIL